MRVDPTEENAPRARPRRTVVTPTAGPLVRTGVVLFLLTGVVSLLAASVWLFLRHERLLEFYYDSEMLALTHLLTLGFISSVIMGALVMLAPTALKIHARSHRILLVQYALYLIGVSGMVAHFYFGGRLGLALTAPFVLASTVLQLVNFRDVWSRARSGDPVACHVAAALVHFVLAALLGNLLAWNKVRGFLGIAPMNGLYAHAHLAGLGWVTTMILGLHFKLMPPTAGSKRFLLLRFALLQIAIVGLAACWLLSLPWHALFAGIILLCVVWQAAGPAVRFVRLRLFDPPLIPLVLLVGSAGLGLVLALGIPADSSELRPRLQMAYAFVALFGWAVYSFTTFAFKLLPTWIWQERFQKDWGKKPVPGVRDLYNQRLRKVSDLLLALGVLITATAIGAESPRGAQVGTGLVFAAVVCFFSNFVLMVRRPALED